MLLGAFTDWEPPFEMREPGLRPGEEPIPGVDYDEGARSFDMLPLSVQEFHRQAKLGKPSIQ